jgi:inosine-uridine nucleoside N-ribohydrolase
MLKALAPLMFLLPLLVGGTPTATPQASTTPQVPVAKVIFDTDIGDDIDDAYALALLLRSPEVQVVCVTTAFEDTRLRALLATRFLKSAGRGEVPVYEGPKTPGKPHFTQTKWAEGSPDRSYPDAIEFMLGTIRSNPGQVTLVAVAPLTNVGALIARDPKLFGKETGMTRALEELTAEWSAATNRKSPTLFDAVAAAYAVKPEICPTTPMRIEVDDKGFTRRVDGAPNANVCLRSSADQFLDFFMQRSF